MVRRQWWFWNIVRGISLALLLQSVSLADDPSSSPVPLNVREEDASPDTFPYQIRVTNGTLTDNGDGTVSLATGGGAGGNSFETINVPAGTDPVAESSTDTLNITETSFLTLTGTAATDTIDITQVTTDLGTDGLIAANAVALTTDTTGNYVASVATTAPITGGAAGSEGATLTIAIDSDIDNVSFGITIDGGGSAITTGVKGYLRVPFDMTITGWDIVADQSGSIVVDVWKDTYANFPPVDADSIAGTELPTLSSVQKNQDNTLSSWTTTVAEDDYIGFNVDSITTVQRVHLSIKGDKA